MPFYFAFLTTMMFYVFIHEKVCSYVKNFVYRNEYFQVDVAIVEVGIGGEYDCTNIIQFVDFESVIFILSKLLEYLEHRLYVELPR